MNGPSSPPDAVRVWSVGGLIALLRPRQWIKNAFVAAPLLLTPDAMSWTAAGQVALGVLAFCAVSSAVYVLNDYVDRDADRMHPGKRVRPLAAGTVSTASALALMVLLAGAGLGLAFLLSLPFAMIVAAYVGINIGYSFGLKHVAIVDVLLVALGFVLRVEGGAALVGVEVTVWLTVMAGLLALFIGLAKRRDDLVRKMGVAHRASLEGYNKPFLDHAVAIVLGALLVGYLVYTTDVTVAERLGTDRLVYTTPFVVAGVLRYLQIMFVEERSGEPTELVLGDPALRAAVVAWGVTFGFILYV